QHRLRAPHRSEIVRAHHLFEVLRLCVFDLVENGEAGIVDQDIDMSGFGDETLAVSTFRDVGDDDAAFHAVRRALTSDVIELLSAARGNDEIGPAMREFEGRRPADTARCASDDDVSVAKPHLASL